MNKSKYYFWKTVSWIIVGGCIIGLLAICCKLTGAVIALPLWDYLFLEWLQTASVGEVVVLFGGVLFIIRLFTH